MGRLDVMLLAHRPDHQVGEERDHKQRGHGIHGRVVERDRRVDGASRLSCLIALISGPKSGWWRARPRRMGSMTPANSSEHSLLGMRVLTGLR